ncbi:hypothetical protein KIN20_017426 [Parelaphostrongylus tenuis]|uniref:Uncharacterized protein n=1 Tax=Parelaphostrongylus tenuis TaxID=148309 RepID=A0AAD5MHY4_PARTN|nr:hypothetical protein KIN20_017426 [Parelaphostrongylus tenuis]
MDDNISTVIDRSANIPLLFVKHSGYLYNQQGNGNKSWMILWCTIGKGNELQKRYWYDKKSDMYKRRQRAVRAILHSREEQFALRDA